GLLGPLSRLRDGVAELYSSRASCLDFAERLRQGGVKPPALVFIAADSADMTSRSLIINSPGLDDPILRARDLGPRNWELVKEYPDRDIWLYDARSPAAGPRSQTYSLVLLRARLRPEPTTIKGD